MIFRSLLSSWTVRPTLSEFPSDIPVVPKSNRLMPRHLRSICLLLVATLVPLSFLRAPYPDELVLQHLPTVVGLVTLFIYGIRFGISGVSFYCLITFLLLHVVGARWIYSFVPYDDWCMTVCGESLSGYMGWERNHYDRLVHFGSGILFLAPSSEILQRFGGMRPLGAALSGIAFVLAIGAVYEILEWQLAELASPAQAEAYNGQQGDVWDPQKDMALAGFGALIAAGAFFRWNPSER